MEYAALEREIRIEAAPAVVFDVVSRPEHMREWWPDDARFDRAPGAVGQVVFGEFVEAITVVEIDPPRTFSFRWVAPSGETPSADNALLVTFTLEPAGEGTLLRLRETGWRERGWEVAVLEQSFREHEQGWDLFLPRLRDYAPAVAAR